MNENKAAEPEEPSKPTQELPVNGGIRYKMTERGVMSLGDFNNQNIKTQVASTRLDYNHYHIISYHVTSYYNKQEKPLILIIYTIIHTTQHNILTLF